MAEKLQTVTFISYRYNQPMVMEAVCSVFTMVGLAMTRSPEDRREWLVIHPDSGTIICYCWNARQCRAIIKGLARSGIAATDGYPHLDQAYAALEGLQARGYVKYYPVYSPEALRAAQQLLAAFQARGRIQHAAA